MGDNLESEFTTSLIQIATHSAAMIDENWDIILGKSFNLRSALKMQH